jgi:hypothetical protein
MKLPKTVEVVEILKAKPEAVDAVSGLIERNLELEEIFEMLQPLLYQLSTMLYTNDEPVELSTLVVQAVEMLKGVKH